MRLLDFLFPPRGTDLLVRDTDVLCAAPRVVGAHATLALLPYRDLRVKAAICEAKFHGNEQAQLLLAQVLRESVQETRPFALVPMPLSPQRKRERGYNQVERICTLSKLPVQPHVLLRIRDTRPQTSLSGLERRRAMDGAFEARDVDPSLLYILVDDVVTTGATMCAAATTLRSAGATVKTLALAH